MEKKEEGTKRQFVRVDGFFPVLWKRLPTDQYEKEKEHFFQRRDVVPQQPWDVLGWLSQGLWDAEGTSESENRLDAALSSVHIKLDLILSLLMEKRVDPIYRTPPILANISGAGIRIRAKGEFELDAYYELKILLPILPVRLIRTLGKVVRVNKVTENGGSLSEVSFRFEIISEEDRETIIHYTFKRQRELLREKKKAD